MLNIQWIVMLDYLATNISPFSSLSIFFCVLFPGSLLNFYLFLHLPHLWDILLLHLLSYLLFSFPFSFSYYIFLSTIVAFTDVSTTGSTSAFVTISNSVFCYPFLSLSFILTITYILLTILLSYLSSSSSSI